MKLGRIPKKNEVYKEFRVYHKNCNLSISRLCQDIYNFAKHYADMYFCKSGDAVLKSLYEDIKNIRMDVAYPFLLKIHDDCDKGLITIKELSEIVRLCVSYVLRRAICDIPTNSLNKTFATMKNDIREDDYLKSVKASFVLLDSYKEFPSNERFLATLLTRDIYNMNRCRYILRQLENWDNKSVVCLDNLTIEHIIPQNPQLSADWIAALGSDWNEIQKKYLHTIGNLTLTAYNSEMSDSSFSEKLDMTGGFRETPLRLNKYIVSQTTWGKEQVNERAVQLGEISINVWPYPTLSDSELEPYRKPDDSAPQYSLESYDQLNAYNRILFEKLNKRILNLGTYVKQGFTKTYVSYKVDTTFAAIFLQKEKLRICAGIPIGGIFDPKSLCRLNNNWNPAGNAELFLDSLDNLDDVMAIIEQAFRLQDIG
jgi:predicted transport protein